MDCKEALEAKPRVDFLQYLETNMSLYIMSLLHDPADLVRATSVSRFWRQFVIENGFAKELCLKTFSGSSNILGTVNQSKGRKWDSSLQTDHDHEVYAALLYAFQKSEVSPFCLISKGISASSTSSNNSIAETMNSSYYKSTYWSSNGHSNTNVPETLTYKILRGTMAITQIDVSPLPAEGSPFTFSAKSVRFIVGHSKSPRKNETDPIADDEIEWTYTSPEFPMKHGRSMMQVFKLSQPILCFDGYLKIELLGRVQRDQKDGLFYIRVDHVGVRGHCLLPAFNAKILQRYGKPLLFYNPDKLGVVFKINQRYRQPSYTSGRVFKAIRQF
ncbi:hypothetical protein ACJIZ3_020064 [Penstemon smallii]|uniref:F-box domain-containing protein n=1 Tax=Penstemon smallii TaxID=265156 RepID=A0ABD3SI57_9LAMI